VTRAITNTIERAPGGGDGYTVRFADASRLWFRRFAFCYQADAIGTVAEKLVELKASAEEKARVLGLLVRELDHRRAAVVTAEVPWPVVLDGKAAA